MLKERLLELLCKATNPEFEMRIRYILRSLPEILFDSLLVNQNAPQASDLHVSFAFRKFADCQAKFCMPLGTLTIQCFLARFVLTKQACR